MLKKIMATILSTALLLTSIPSSSLQLTPSAAIGDTVTYVYDGYSADLTVTGGWGSTELVTVALTDIVCRLPKMSLEGSDCRDKANKIKQYAL